MPMARISGHLRLCDVLYHEKTLEIECHNKEGISLLKIRMMYTIMVGILDIYLH